MIHKGDKVRVVRPIGLAKGYVGVEATVRQASGGHTIQDLELFIPTERGQGRLIRCHSWDVEGN